MKSLNTIKLLSLAAALSLTGCASYYYPLDEPVEEIVYVEGDGSYVGNEAYFSDEPEYYEEYTVYDDSYSRYSGSYASSRYYPWWSIDYFYLGSSHGSSFSLGYDWGSPYYRHYVPYDPFYRHSYSNYWSWNPYYSLGYSYFYSPFNYGFSHHYVWQDYYWRNRYNNYYRSRYGGHDRWRRGDRRGHDGRNNDQYAGDNRRRRGDNSLRQPARDRDQSAYAGRDGNGSQRRRMGEDGRIPEAGRARHPGRAGNGEMPIRRQVSVAPATQNGNRGMEVRNRGDQKLTPTKTHPARPVASTQPVTRSPGDPAASRSPAWSSARGSNGIVRSSAGTKPVRTRPVPAPRPQPETGISISSAPVVTGRRSGSTTVRSNQDSKSRPTRTQPVRTQPSVVRPTSRSNEHLSPVVKVAPQKRQPAVVRQRNYQPIARTRPSAPAVRNIPQPRTRSGQLPANRQQPGNRAAANRAPATQRAPVMRNQAPRPAPVYQQKRPQAKPAPARSTRQAAPRRNAPVKEVRDKR